ncbi:MAG: ABC transporter permease [Acidimicrobiales bacterium]
MTDIQHEGVRVSTDEGASGPSVLSPGGTHPGSDGSGRLDHRDGVIANRAKTTRVVDARVSVWRRLTELWGSRELLVFLVRKEIKVKYKNSVLGLLWSLLNPLLTLLIYVVVFQVILGNNIPDFALFLFSGLLVYNLFQTGILSGTGAVVDNGSLVKKVAFPREVLPLASVGTSFMFFVFQSVVMILFLVGFHRAPDWSQLWLLIPALASLLVFSGALSVFLSAVTVYLRDIRHLMEVLLTLWFWAVPVVYAYASISAKMREHHIPTILYLADPLAPLVLTFQRVLYNKTSFVAKGAASATQLLPTRGPMWFLAADMVVFVASVVLFVGAMAVFVRLEGNFAEEL